MKGCVRWEDEWDEVAVLHRITTSPKWCPQGCHMSVALPAPAPVLCRAPVTQARLQAPCTGEGTERVTKGCKTQSEGSPATQIAEGRGELGCRWGTRMGAQCHPAPLEVAAGETESITLAVPMVPMVVRKRMQVCGGRGRAGTKCPRPVEG